MQQEIYSNYLNLIFGRDFDRLRVVILSGLPGSGKSTLAEILQDEYGYAYVSTDTARVEMLKLTKGKFATTKQYVKLKGQVYDFVREKAGQLLQRNNKVIIDGTHLNEQLEITLQYLRSLGMDNNEILTVYVDAGGKSVIVKRFVDREGKNADGRSWVEAWETAYDYFRNQIKRGAIRIPENIVLGCSVVWVKNY
ncbi:MAG: hypothetical protein ACD_40C00056G0002 [uncultured bacterium]|nr:MAG: hypothetical protein ACD_40C00056G0002 [uncultured bacterium]